MALSGSEAIYVRAMILHGNKQDAVAEAYPRLQKGFEQAALNYLQQNPEIQRHIDAGIMYLYKHVAPQADVPEPAPLTTEDKQQLLQLIVDGTRETPTYIVTKQGLRLIFTQPAEQAVAEARWMLKELEVAVKTQWLF